MEACKPNVCCRSYVISRNFGFWLCLICFLLRYRTERHLASCVFVVKKEHSDFWLQLVTAYGHFCCLDVTLSMFVSCVHTVTSSAKMITCGALTADARSSMLKRKRSGDLTDPCRTPYCKVTFRLLTPSNITNVSRLDRHAWFHRIM